MAEACRDLRDPLVRFVTYGLTADGYFCLYFSATNVCETDTVAYDGTGIKIFTQRKVPPYTGTCTGGTFVEYDGIGLKASTYYDEMCAVG
jgi:hypothetical protein